MVSGIEEGGFLEQIKLELRVEVNDIVACGKNSPSRCHFSVLHFSESFLFHVILVDDIGIGIGSMARRRSSNDNKSLSIRKSGSKFHWFRQGIA